MNTQIFINLPVADLPRSLAFFEALGFSHNPQFSDDTGACIVINEHIHVMVLTHPKFLQFTPKTICDTKKSVEVLNCLSCDSREQVEDLVAKAVAAGGSMYAEPKDYGFMYQHSFADPDGHCWELFHMSAMPPKA
ncbi:MAG: glyoxalase/bleomycin resistance/extradiol dioxygenase family protein [Verrucomicrobiales bacterium]|nr:glyoxalase/bleomycin resistance/extradiol dioxygenase family protein [Verrucomicrobiales bacterium]